MIRKIKKDKAEILESLRTKCGWKVHILSSSDEELEIFIIGPEDESDLELALGYYGYYDK